MYSSRRVPTGLCLCLKLTSTTARSPLHRAASQPRAAPFKSRRSLLPVRFVASLAAIVTLALLISGCGGDENTLESLAGTPAAIHIVKDVEAMSRACQKKTAKARAAGVKAFTELAQITAIHPKATFGPEDTDVTMHQLLRRTVEKTGHCIGVTVDAHGRYHSN
jgi:hypothetical protein